MKYTFITFLLVLFGTQSFAQTIISGKIQSAESKQPLAYASILIKNTNIGVLSDENGVFELTVPAEHKSDSLIVSFIGYQSTTQAINNHSVINLSLSDNTIEQIVVTPIDADSIMQVARQNYIKNHIQNNMKQAGFMRAQFRENGEVFQLSESSYDLFYEKNDKGATRKIHPNRSRMVIDSATYQQMNEIFNFKKDTFLVEPLNFISVGQEFNSDFESEQDKKWDYVYEYLGRETYQGFDVYKIKEDAYRKNRKFVESTYLIDVDTYAFLSIEYSSANEDDLNKLIPFAARVALGILGYKFQLNHFNGRVYFRPNGEFFELDKGMFYLSAAVARGGDWISGDMNQEFYLQEQVAVNSVPKKKKNYMQTEAVNEFTDDYFKKVFHLQTSASVKKKISLLQEKNKNFSGKIYSNKHKKWLKKQERKKGKK